MAKITVYSSLIGVILCLCPLFISTLDVSSSWGHNYTDFVDTHRLSLLIDLLVLSHSYFDILMDVLSSPYGARISKTVKFRFTVFCILGLPDFLILCCPEIPLHIHVCILHIQILLIFASASYYLSLFVVGYWSRFGSKVSLYCIYAAIILSNISVFMDDGKAGTLLVAFLLYIAGMIMLFQVLRQWWRMISKVKAINLNQKCDRISAAYCFLSIFLLVGALAVFQLLWIIVPSHGSTLLSSTLHVATVTAFIIIIMDYRIIRLRENAFEVMNELILSLEKFMSFLMVLRTSKQAMLENKKMFFRTCTHEIRTPLNTAFVGINLLHKTIRETYDRKACFEILKDVHDSCDVALELVNDMLAFDKMEEGKLTLERYAFAVWAVIKKTMGPFHMQVCWFDFVNCFHVIIHIEILLL